MWKRTKCNVQHYKVTTHNIHILCKESMFLMFSLQTWHTMNMSVLLTLFSGRLGCASNVQGWWLLDGVWTGCLGPRVRPGQDPGRLLTGTILQKLDWRSYSQWNQDHNGSLVSGNHNADRTRARETDIYLSSLLQVSVFLPLSWCRIRCWCMWLPLHYFPKKEI